MTTFEIDNQAVLVVLKTNESYTPASGTVQKLKLKTLEFGVCDLQVGNVNAGELLAEKQETQIIADDTATFTSNETTVISGFVLN